MKRLPLFPVFTVLLLLSVLVPASEALAATTGLELPDNPTNAYITLGILVAAAVLFFTEVIPFLGLHSHAGSCHPGPVWRG